jgi:hypothetical protein
MKKLLSVVLAIALVAAASNYQLVCDEVLNATSDSDFYHELRTIGGSGRYRYEIDGLPAGLKNQGPVIAGIPRTSGKYPIWIRSYDDQGNSDVR